VANTLRSPPAKAAAAEADTQKSLNQETVTNRFSEEKNSPERTATKLPNGTDFLSLSLSPLSLSIAHTAWYMEQQAEGDMHKRRARKLVDQANGCDSHYCMWRIRNRRKRGKGSREGERRERQERQREEKEFRNWERLRSYK
jgi:hypothetical protein